MGQEKKKWKTDENNIGEKYPKMDDVVKDILENVKKVEEGVSNLRNVKELRELDYSKKLLVELQGKTKVLRNHYFSLGERISEIVESEEWESLTGLSEKLKLLNEKISAFLELFSGRKKVNEELIKKLDYLIMNEAIKNEMASHIFDMVNRGDSKEKLMNASLEFVYFLKEIESDETLKELKHLKNFVLTAEKEEINIHHFLIKLEEKLAYFSKTVDEPMTKILSLREFADEIKKDIDRLLSHIEEKSQSLNRETEDK